MITIIGILRISKLINLKELNKKFKNCCFSLFKKVAPGEKLAQKYKEKRKKLYHIVREP